MRNPTSAYPGLPHPARGTSQRSRNCPESGPPCPQNGSWWTERIVSAADGFVGDSFPKIKRLGGGTNRRSSPRPQGPPRRRETFAQSPFPHLHPHRHSRESGNPGWTWGGGAPSLTPCATATPQPSPHMAVAPATRLAATRVKPRRRCQGGLPPKNNQCAKPCRSYRESPPSKQSTVCVPSRFRKRKKSTDYPPNYNNHTARCRRRPPAPPSDRCDAVALRCATMPQSPLTRHKQAVGALWRPLHNHHSRTHPPPSFPRKRESRVAARRGASLSLRPPCTPRRGNPATLPPQGRRASDPAQAGIQGSAPGWRGLLHVHHLALHGQPLDRYAAV